LLYDCIIHPREPKLMGNACDHSCGGRGRSSSIYEEGGSEKQQHVGLYCSIRARSLGEEA
jgi:hypothetical protein